VAGAPGAAAASPSPGASRSPDEVKAAQSRVGDLEKTVADLQSQIAMKNKAIAELEARLAKSK
jgi:Tfp pilus assembly protein FimV